MRHRPQRTDGASPPPASLIFAEQRSAWCQHLRAAAALRQRQARRARSSSSPVPRSCCAARPSPPARAARVRPQPVPTPRSRGTLGRAGALRTLGRAAAAPRLDGQSSAAGLRRDHRRRGALAPKSRGCRSTASSTTRRGTPPFAARSFGGEAWLAAYAPAPGARRGSSAEPALRPSRRHALMLSAYRSAASGDSPASITPRPHPVHPDAARSSVAGARRIAVLALGPHVVVDEHRATRLIGHRGAAPSAAPEAKVVPLCIGVSIGTVENTIVENM